MRSAAIAVLLLLFPAQGRAGQGTMAEAEPDWPGRIIQLRERLDRVPNDHQAREQLAIAYNNYAVTLADAGNVDDAVEQLEEALRLDPASVQLKANLATIHVKAATEAYQAHRLTEAKRLVQEALAVTPNNAEPYVLLGEIEYNSQRLKEAKAAWEKAVALRPDLLEVRTKLSQLDQELPVESKFEKLSQVYFDLRYTTQLERASGFDIQDMLLKARREVGSDFAFWPTRKIVALLYTAEEFRTLRQQAPEWVAGQYDGKIRVPLPGQDLDHQAVTRILYHEYTHAVVYELTKGLLPTWFNEGLAEYEAWKHEAPPWTLLREAAAQARLLPWQALSTPFSASATTMQAGLAYEQAHNIVRYLVERHSFWRIKRLLKAVGEGTPFEQALQAEYRLKLPRLEENWRAWLKELLAASPAAP